MKIERQNTPKTVGEQKKTFEGLSHAESPKNNEAEDRLLPVCKNLGTFVTFLRSSSRYQEAFDAKKQEIVERVHERSGEEPTDDEVRAIYEASDEFKDLMFDVMQYIVHIKYDPSEYSETFGGMFEEYRVSATDELSHEGTVELDSFGRERSRRHDRGADQLADELVEQGVLENPGEGTDEIYERKHANHIIARAVMRAFLVDGGEDKWEAARTMDVVRRIRGVEDQEKALKAYYRDHYVPGESRWYDNPELIEQEQARYRELFGEGQTTRAGNYMSDKMKPWDQKTGLRPQPNAEHDWNPIKKRPFR